MFYQVDTEAMKYDKTKGRYPHKKEILLNKNECFK